MPVLSQYSVRSKQEYIFRSSRMKEMRGASGLISNVFERLISIAEDDGIHVQHISEPFDLQNVLSSFTNGTLQMVELSRGGGNSMILYDCKSTYARVNALFTRNLLVNTPGIVPFCAGIEVGNDREWNYSQDRRRLSQEASQLKNRMMKAGCIISTPFSQISRKTYQPITEYRDGSYLTAEASAKRRYAVSDSQKDLQELAQQKGVESLLAVVHADGNNMGQKITNLLHGESDYTICIEKLRQFSQKTRDVFSSVGAKAVQDACSSLSSKTGKPIEVRWLICDGDDATFVCNARYAKVLSQAYLHAVEQEQGFSSCAGICIFHARYPFYMAYSFAEQCCGNAKAIMKNQKDASADESWVDFYYLHSGLDGDLDDIRDRQGVSDRIARPYCVSGKRHPSIKELDAIADALQCANVTRTNIKTIGNEWQNDSEFGRLELHRVCYRAPGLQEKLSNICPGEDDLLKLIYDLSEVYDLWYMKNEGRK